MCNDPLGNIHKQAISLHAMTSTCNPAACIASRVSSSVSFLGLLLFCVEFFQHFILFT